LCHEKPLPEGNRMTGKEFMKRVANGKDDFLQAILDLLKKEKIPFCAIGGLAVNAYAEPVVSLDLDLVMVAEEIDPFVRLLREKYSVTPYSNSINVTEATSDLRLQIQTDPRYQPFIRRAAVKTVLGYKIPVARIEDVLQGKIWAAMDKTRRPSKRQKDLSDILRLTEMESDLVSLLPRELKKELFPDRAV